MTNNRINNLNDAIEISRGGAAVLWDYSASLGELTIRINLANGNGNVHFIFNACTRVESSNAWSVVDFEIQQLKNDRSALIDSSAKFFVECGSIRAFRNVPPLFDVAIPFA
jgi:hypothetical protein